MHPVPFKEQTGELKAPEGMEEDCMSLPYHAGFDVQRPDTPYHTVTCCYELNKEEIESLVKTGKFYLVFYGRTIPPIMPMVENPFELGLIANTIK